jgi:hypothetical protein
LTTSSEFAVLARFTVSRLIERDDTIVGCKDADLMLPVFAVAAPAVQEEQGRVPLAAYLADEVEPVRRPDGYLGRLGAAVAAQRGSNEKEGQKQRQKGGSRVHDDLRKVEADSPEFRAIGMVANPRTTALLTCFE